LGHRKTRWLSLLPAVQRIIALKSYFLSLEKCPVSLQNFFENSDFLPSQLKIFPLSIKYIEKQDTTIIEVKNEFSRLLDKLNCRTTERFLTTAVRDQLRELEKEGHIIIEKFNNYAKDFYDACNEYTQEWCLLFLVQAEGKVDLEECAR
jgi:hypothetical protein